MCVKLFYSEKQKKYDPNKSLEMQLKGCRKVVINYEPDDKSIERFVDEIEKLCDRGNSKSLNIELVHNNFLAGAKMKKRINEVEVDTGINDLIKMMVLSYSEADKKLEQLSIMCSEGVCSVQKKT